MSKPVRLFIASSIPTMVRDAVTLSTEPLRGALPDASWTRNETMHFTYAFLGEQKEEILPPLFEALEGRLAGSNTIRARLTEAGFFPSESKPRVGWIGLEPEDAISAVAEQVRAALEECAVSFDAKPFRPHLTIVRPRTRWSSKDRERFQAAVRQISSREFQIDSGSVFSSRRSSVGARHDELRRFPFTAEIGGQ
jgi:2'-5' RNA ligase